MVVDKSSFFNKSYTYAVVGATIDESKSGYSVFKFMKEHGFSVVAINPHYSSILGSRCYPDLISVIDEGVLVDVVIFVTKPFVSKRLIEDYVDLGLNMFWFQPGSEFDNVSDFCMDYGVDCSCDGSCFMLNYSYYFR